MENRMCAMERILAHLLVGRRIAFDRPVTGHYLTVEHVEGVVKSVDLMSNAMLVEADDKKTYDVYPCSVLEVYHE